MAVIVVAIVLVTVAVAVFVVAVVAVVGAGVSKDMYGISTTIGLKNFVGDEHCSFYNSWKHLCIIVYHTPGYGKSEVITIIDTLLYSL